MSRTDKDDVEQGERHPHHRANLRGWPKHKRATRRAARKQAATDLRQGREPAPTYPVERTYYD